MNLRKAAPTIARLARLKIQAEFLCIKDARGNQIGFSTDMEGLQKLAAKGFNPRVTQSQPYQEASSAPIRVQIEC